MPQVSICSRITYSIAGLLPVMLLLLVSCHRNEMPKPYAHARLTYPSSGYATFSEAGYPCRFEYPASFTQQLKTAGSPGSKWADFRMEQYGITLYTCFMESDMPDFISFQFSLQEQLLKKKLPPYATVTQSILPSGKKNVIIHLFEVSGNSAIPLEFLITDNRHRVFTGKLLFDKVPDRDSLADIMDGLGDDMLHLLRTFEFTAKP